jgi:hypothetical protein
MGNAMTAGYERALQELVENLVQAEAMANLLDYFAGLLRGRPRETEGPPLELYPSMRELRRALERRSSALDAVRNAWETLAGEAQEGRPSPNDVLEAAESH